MEQLPKMLYSRELGAMGRGGLEPPTHGFLARLSRS